MVISHETPQSQEFLKSTITWISLIFSKSRDLILISLDRIHYYQVLDRIPWHIDHSHVCGGWLRCNTEYTKIHYKVDHDPTMIKEDIFVISPVPFHSNFPFFMCWLFISCKQDEKRWNYDELLSIYRHVLKIRNSDGFDPEYVRFWSKSTPSFNTIPCEGV